MVKNDPHAQAPADAVAIAHYHAHVYYDPATSRDRAERLRERISALEVPLPRSVGRLTVSIGVAEYRPGETIMQTFARADLALYRAKAAGRNRVES